MTEGPAFNKGTAAKRLMIYLLLSFGLAWLFFFLVIPKGVYWEDMSSPMQSFAAFGMFAPVIAHILTRYITREGFALTGEGSMMLGITFAGGKWVFFLIAMLLPWVYTECGSLVALLMHREIFDPEYYKVLEIDKDVIPLLPLAMIVSGTIASFAAFGEESGWRGYMMPKLFQLMGRVPALIAGGIIWGLWHAPLTCIGHNFGTDYPGFPYTGIVRMCVFCVFMGIILTAITERSGSIWPAAILHAVNNTNPGILNAYLNFDRLTEAGGIAASFTGRMLPMVVIAAGFLFFSQRGGFKADE